MVERDPDEFEPEADDPGEHPDAPEADYLEQHDEVLPEYGKGPTIAPDVPEADAIEQSIEVGYGDDELTDRD